MNKIFLKVSFVFLTIFIGIGCAARYGCNAPDGKSCSSITKVYTESFQEEKSMENELEVHDDLEIQGYVDKTESVEKEDQKKSGESFAQTDKIPEIKSDPVSSNESPLLKSNHIPTRSSPSLLRIWLAPWEDNDGDLHQPGFIYLLIDNGKWIY